MIVVTQKCNATFTFYSYYLMLKFCITKSLPVYNYEQCNNNIRRKGINLVKKIKLKPIIFILDAGADLLRIHVSAIFSIFYILLYITFDLWEDITSCIGTTLFVRPRICRVSAVFKKPGSESLFMVTSP